MKVKSQKKLTLTNPLKLIELTLNSIKSTGLITRIIYFETFFQHGYCIFARFISLISLLLLAFKKYKIFF